MVVSSNSENYSEHVLFAKINDLISFYRNLSYANMFWFPMGVKDQILNIDIYMFSSIQCTIESIKMLLENKKINDANALLRKLYDSMIVNLYVIIYLEKNFNIESMVVEKINDWVNGKKSLPKVVEMLNYINEYQPTNEIYQILQKDNRYKKIRDRCNDYMHYNSFSTYLINDNELYIKRKQFLDIFWADIVDIFVFHFALLFSVKPNYMMASDYMDSLEAGQTPEDGAEYFVAEYIQDVFDSIIKIKRPDIAKSIVEKTSMKLM